MGKSTCNKHSSEDMTLIHTAALSQNQHQKEIRAQSDFYHNVVKPFTAMSQDGERSGCLYFYSIQYIVWRLYCNTLLRFAINIFINYYCLLCGFVICFFLNFKYHFKKQK